jgi:tetratricopeptide (TPR) repeat protein
MTQQSIDRFLPLIDEFVGFVKRAFLAKIVVAFLLFTFLLLAIIGFFLGIDFLTAFSIAMCTAFAFCWYLIRVYIKDGAVKHAISLTRRVEESCEGFDEKSLAHLFSRLALSIRCLPTRLFDWKPEWLSAPCNQILGYLAWVPLHTLAEVLFFSSIDHHIQQIKETPTNLQDHASLANCYIMLANHYQEPLKAIHLMTWPKIFLSSSLKEALETKSRASSNSAIEELTILSSFAPDELWVHDQLAISYRELEMPEKEIEECEAIIRLCPDDDQALLRLGVLYFRQNKNAKGLQVFERLKSIQPLLAEELISHYGAYKPILLST